MLDYLLLAGGLLAGLVSVFALRTGWARAQYGGWVWIPFLAAAGLAGYGLRRIDRWLPDSAPLARLSRSHPSWCKRVGAACLGLAVLIATLIVIRLWPDHFNWAGTSGPWLLSLALVLSGGYLLGNLGEGQPASGTGGSLTAETPVNPPARESLHLPLWLEIGLFVAIAALAVYLRLHRLDEIPTGIYVDETNGALDALNILEGSRASPFGTGWYGTPNGFAYYIAGLFKFFGPSVATLKLVSLIPAILTVWAVYPLGRLLWGSLGGLSAMFLMAISRWHLSMSRWGWNELAPLLFQAVCDHPSAPTVVGWRCLLQHGASLLHPWL
jgi:hypothetical protein